MFPRGKVIRIYLADGSPTGVRYAELGNWSGQALLIPRSLFSRANSKWPDFQRPGVYFLFGPEAEGKRRLAYIGEAENALDRLQSHYQKKDFWEQAIIFTSKDENLTKAHVRYLESVLITSAREVGRYSLENTTVTSPASLPRGDRDMMDEYLDHLKVLLASLGHPVLEPLLPEASPRSTERDDSPTFFYTSHQASAEGVISPEGFVVRKGSTALPRTKDRWYGDIKQALLDDGVLTMRPDGLLEFARDHLFGSPSAAAAVISGTSVNGRMVWKTKDGTTLKAWETSSLPQDA